MSKGKDESVGLTATCSDTENYSIDFPVAYALTHPGRTLLRDAVQPADGCVGFATFSTFPYFQHLCDVKFSIESPSYQRVGQPPGLAAFFAHIAHIISLSSKEKMRGIYAWSVVAFMQNPKSIRNRTMCNYPRKTVGQHGETTAYENVAVTASVSPGPWPAFVFGYFGDVLPQALFDFIGNKWNDFLRVIHTDSMFDFSEGRRLQPAVFAFSGYQREKENQA